LFLETVGFITGVSLRGGFFGGVCADHERLGTTRAAAITTATPSFNPNKPKILFAVLLIVLFIINGTPN
jgi:hypothetical protein